MLGPPDVLDGQLGRRRREGRVAGGLEPVEQGEIASAPEDTEETPPGGGALAPEDAEHGLGPRPIRAVERGSLDAQVVEQHIEVPDRAERGAEPSELGTKGVGPLLVDQRTTRAEECPQPPGRDPELVQALGVGAEPGTGIVREQPSVLRSEGTRQVHRGARAGGRLVRVERIGEIERAEELRPALAVEGAGPPERLLEPAQRPLVSLDQLDLELVERARHPLSVEDRDDVVHDLRAVDPQPVAARPQPRHRHEPGAADERGQEVGDVGRRRPRQARRPRSRGVRRRSAA